MALASQGDEVAVSHVCVGENRAISGCRQGEFTALCLPPPYNQARRENRRVTTATSARQ